MWFVDTPGFDDTQRSETEILEEIATYFVKLYDKGIRFSGLLYLQRITDPRMSGSAVKNLELFKLICGNEAYPLVRLITTRWDEVGPDSAEYKSCIDRMRQLSDDSKFFQPLLQEGAQLLRHDMSAESGKAIVDSLLLDEQKLALNIQKEMLDSHKTLGQTSAGLYLNREHAALAKRFETELQEIQDSLTEARKERDEEALSQLRAEQEQYQSRRAKLEQDRQQMMADFRELDSRKARELARELRESKLPAEQSRELESNSADVNGSNGSNGSHASHASHGSHGSHGPFGRHHRHSSSTEKVSVDSVHDTKGSRRDRMRQHLSAGWHRAASRDRWQSRRTALQDVQSWLWNVIEEVQRAASRSR